MMPIELVNALKSVVGLFLLWYVLCFLFRDYIIDAFRDELFGLRYDLFNYIASIGLSFDDERHTLLRNFINTTIRFSHKLTFFRLILAQVSKTQHPAMYKQELFEKWSASLETLPTEQKERLLGILFQVMRSATIQMVWRSPFLLPIVVLYKAGSFISEATFRSWKTLVYDQIRVGLQGQEAEDANEPRGGSPETLPAIWVP